MADNSSSKFPRRSLLAGMGAAAVASLLPQGNPALAQADADSTGPAAGVPKTGKVITNGKIKQSVMAWCFKPMKPEELAKHCLDMGIGAIEGVSHEQIPTLKKMGMEISLVSSHGFPQGYINPDDAEEVTAKLTKGIDIAKEIGTKRVITFTGMRVKDVDDETMEKRIIAGFKTIVPYAEKNKITLCMEHLNTRDDSHPMKGHPGYFGDDLDRCKRIIDGVGSENLKLLFDIYHVQIMHGDVIRRMGEMKDYIAHLHTAGNPGRRELDDQQELNYPAIMRAVTAMDYDGYVAQEFIPTWEDPILALRHAAKLCDVS